MSWLGRWPPDRRRPIVDPFMRGSSNKLVAAQLTSVDDREHLAAFREGHRDAMDRVYRQFVLEVAAFLRRGFMYNVDASPTRFGGVRDSFELEAYVQEVFARAFEPRARLAYDGLRPYGGFLIGIARHVVLDRLRSSARHGELLAAPDVIEAMAAPLPAEAELSENDRRADDLVGSFLAIECDERDRTLYELRYGRALTQAETGSTAGLSRIQVRRWETKFRARLLRFLKRADYVRGT